MTLPMQPKNDLPFLSGWMRQCGGVFLVVALGVAAGACGTRVESGGEASISQSPLSSSAADNSTGGAVGSSTVDAAAGPAAGLATSQPTRPAAVPGAATQPIQSSSGSRAATTPTSDPVSRPGTANRPAGGGPPVANNSPSPPVTVPEAGTRRSPVVLGTAGTLSGPIGSSTLPMVQGAQIWVRSVNDRGGLNGHQVSILIYDDGGDTARHRAQVQQAIERDKVIAFLAQPDATTGSPTVPYINEKRVPVIGTDGAGEWAYGSPMYFPQQSSSISQFVGLGNALAHELVPKGERKLGVVYCVELPLCQKLAQATANSAKEAGMELVYSGQASIAQPDFTAECLSLRNAGAEVVAFHWDQSTIVRFIASCIRQNYRPVWAGPALSTGASFKDNPDLEGYVTASSVFPFFQTGTPATDEFRVAMQRYGKGVSPGGGPPIGWVAGKLLEKAAKDLPEPPTSEAILKGLWSVKNDDLGGLTQPLTFVENQNAKPVACGFTWKIEQRTFISPDGFKRLCRDV